MQLCCFCLNRVLDEAKPLFTPQFFSVLGYFCFLHDQRMQDKFVYFLRITYQMGFYLQESNNDIFVKYNKLNFNKWVSVQKPSCTRKNIRALASYVKKHCFFQILNHFIFVIVHSFDFVAFQRIDSLLGLCVCLCV